MSPPSELSPYSEDYRPPPKYVRVGVTLSLSAFLSITIAAALGVVLFSRTDPHHDEAGVFFFGACAFAVVAIATGLAGFVQGIRARRKLGKKPRRRHVVLALSCAFLGLVSGAAGLYLCVSFAGV